MRMRRQRGVVLIAVLLVVALVTVLAVGLAHTNMTRLSLTERRQESAQAWQIWQAGVEWSRDILREDLFRTAYDAPSEFWGRGLKDYPAEGGKLSGRMIDQQGLFNLNNLVRNGQVSETDVTIYRRLLSALNLDSGLADTLADWMDSDHTERNGGAEDQAYASMQPPYRAADRALAQVSELNWVKGYTPSVIASLRPYVAMLPEATPVNVNSASRSVLGAYLPNLDASQIDSAWEALQSHPCANMDCFIRLLPPSVSVDTTRLGVTSQYFLLQLAVVYGQTHAAGEALLQRSGGLPNVVWRERGLSQSLDLDNPISQSDLINMTGGI